MAAKKKALVLSGGGGRGAYHIGVIRALIERGWMEDGKGPDIIAGTSIGAINAAALASGLTIDELEQRWLSMRTEQVHRLSPDIPAVSRPLVSFILRSVLTSHRDDDPSPEDRYPAPPERDTRGWLDKIERVFRATPFRSLLDTTPWRSTLSRWMHFDKINSADAPALLLAATDVQSGDLRVFCNRELKDRPADTIRLDHLMASSSIPTIYPWTDVDGFKYWDGAVLANTPLGPVIDLAAGEDVDIIVVMMTPWDADPEDLRAQLQGIPNDLIQGLSLTLDWALLASYRAALKMMKAYNRIADAALALEKAAEKHGDTSLLMTGKIPQRISEPVVVAPKELMPLDWIIDYEVETHKKLFQLGYDDTIHALDNRLLAGMLEGEQRT